MNQAMQQKRVLVQVATKDGHAAFWVDDLRFMMDGADGCARISLLSIPADQVYLPIISAWSTERVLRAIAEGVQ